MQVTENLPELVSAEKGYLGLVYQGLKLLLDPGSLLAQLAPRVPAMPATSCFALPSCRLIRASWQTNIFLSSFNKGSKAGAHWTGWVLWPFPSQSVWPRRWNMQTGQGWGRSGCRRDWLLGRGKATDMGMVGHQRAVGAGWEMGLRGLEATLSATADAWQGVGA